MTIYYGEDGMSQAFDDMRAKYERKHALGMASAADYVSVLYIPDEKDLVNEPVKYDPTVHDGYIIDEDGDKIFIGRATIAQPSGDNDYGGQPKVSAVDPIKDNVPRVEFVTAENQRKGMNRSSHFPPDPEPGYEASLEAKGADIIESVTDFPASKTQRYYSSTKS